jgi:RNA recognition motif-containing protein
MSELYHEDKTQQHVCWDRKYYNTFEDQVEVLKNSKTIYVGNLSFFTTEQQIYEVFSVAGTIKRVIMGLNQVTKMPCGFCFVEYYNREQACACLNFVSGNVLLELMEICCKYEDKRFHLRVILSSS